MICSLEMRNDWFVHVSDVLEMIEVVFLVSAKEKKKNERKWVSEWVGAREREE